jgi:SAM-dependent MidA family methyltransferase
VGELTGKIAQCIEEEGPIPFSRFMQLALYDEVHGYYRQDNFGIDGDFFTATQLQPVFGAYVNSLAASLLPGFDHFVDIGAGRGSLRESFTAHQYIAVEEGQSIPKTKTAILFSNELIDAMPVDLWYKDSPLHVCNSSKGFAWHPHPPSPGVIERRPQVKAHLAEAWHSLTTGSYILIDYGYRSQEWPLRFPTGSLMSYRRHLASDDVLLNPGQRDITAHVNWDALLEDAFEAGWTLRSFSTLRSSILSLGQDALEHLNLLGDMQLKTLLFSIGESFDVVVLDKK